jgi:hypothetical protein
MRKRLRWLTGARHRMVRAIARASLRRLIRGEDGERAAIATVLAHNVDSPAVGYCIEQLTTLIKDESKDVRQTIGTVFSTAPADTLFARRTFLTSYAESTTVTDTIHAFAEFVVEHGFIDPSFSLDLIERALPRLASPDHAYLAEDLVRFVLRVSSSRIVDELLQRRTMDVFDQLDDRFGQFSGSLLAEWDRA